MKCFAQNTKKITHYSLIPFYFISGINMISIMHFTKKVCIMIFMNCINSTLIQHLLILLLLKILKYWLKYYLEKGR